MMEAFNTYIKPANEQLRKDLGVKKIEVVYVPSTVISTYSYTHRDISGRITLKGWQFDPLGDSK